jgi:cytochrome c
VNDDFVIFTGAANPELARTIACQLDIQLAACVPMSMFVQAKSGYEIAVKQQSTTTEAGAATKQPEEPITSLLASADVERGQTAAKVYSACHSFEKGGSNLIGPNLWGIVDRPRASVPGYDIRGDGGKMQKMDRRGAR